MGAGDMHTTSSNATPYIAHQPRSAAPQPSSCSNAADDRRERDHRAVRPVPTALSQHGDRAGDRRHHAAERNLWGACVRKQHWVIHLAPPPEVFCFPCANLFGCRRRRSGIATARRAATSRGSHVLQVGCLRQATEGRGGTAGRSRRIVGGCNGPCLLIRLASVLRAEEVPAHLGRAEQRRSGVVKHSTPCTHTSG